MFLMSLGELWMLAVQERDPYKLLRPLAETLAERRVLPAGALFVPPDSMYGSLANYGPSADLSWQQQLRCTWEAVGNWQPAAAGARRLSSLPPLPRVAGLAVQDVARGAVLPSLQASPAHSSRARLEACVASC